MAGALGGVEIGGTNVRCVIADGPDAIHAATTVPTTTPDETFARVLAFFRVRAAGVPLRALGVASFGPLDLDERSPTFGSIRATPKPGWSSVDILGGLGTPLGVPSSLDTDVNGAAIAEHRWGAARGVGTLVYITVGTGIGGGGMIDGRAMHGLVHPEMGHMRVPHDRDLDPFPGACPFHGDCLEGLASGPALAARWGVAPESLGSDHQAWDLEARYLAIAIVNVIAVMSPERIVIGGGVMHQPTLLVRIRSHVARLLAGYTPSSAIRSMDAYIVSPALGDRAGVLGAIALADAMAGAIVTR